MNSRLLSLLGLLLTLSTTACSWSEQTTWMEPEFHYFEPKARVFFDSGGDEPGKVDVFRDGGLTVAVDMAEVYWRNSLAVSGWRPDWTLGPTVGFGLTGPAEDSESANADSSSAPVFLLSAGFQFEFPMERSDSTLIVLETGITWGFSADEGFSDGSDYAWYVGFSLLGGSRTSDIAHRKNKAPLEPDPELEPMTP